VAFQISDGLGFEGFPSLGGSRQRQLAGMHDRFSGHRGLPPAIGAFIGEGFGLQQPSPAPAATWADKPFWPTALEEVLRTRVFRGEAPETFAFLFCTLNLDAPDTRA
jgi:hypothetical protein